jgi:DDE_Tnp_1-associated/Transposase DDE domain
MSAPLPLLEALALVPDPRSRRGRIHPLVSVLGLSVTALLAGCTSLAAVAQFGHDRGNALAFPLGFRRGKTPNASALGKIFRRLNVAAPEAALTTWLTARGADTGHLAMDGKTLTGSADGDVPGRHLLAAYATAHQAVVSQLEVARTTNEHKAALRLLGVLPLAGRVITADAMFTHRDVCDTITHGGGDYLLAVKGNQGNLKADLDAEFADEANRPPLRAAAGGRRAADGDHAEQRARADREADAHQHDGVERLLAGLAEVSPGGAGGAGTAGEGGGDRGGGVLHHQPGPFPSGCRPAAGVGAGALGDRERPAPRAGRVPRGGCVSGAHRVVPAGAGGPAEHRPAPTRRGGGDQPGGRHAAVRRPPRRGVTADQDVV